MKLIGLQSENEDLLNRVAQLAELEAENNRLRTESTRAIGVETVPADSTDLSIPEFFKRRDEKTA
jgi:hypothetical protein